MSPTAQTRLDAADAAERVHRHEAVGLAGQARRGAAPLSGGRAMTRSTSSGPSSSSQSFPSATSLANVPVRSAHAGVREPPRDRRARLGAEDAQRRGLARHELDLEVQAAPRGRAPRSSARARRAAASRPCRRRRRTRSSAAVPELRAVDRVATASTSRGPANGIAPRQRRLGARAERRAAARRRGPAARRACRARAPPGARPSTASWIQRTPRSRAMRSHSSRGAGSAPNGSATDSAR